MRSNQPDPGNPWPHDMVITITDDDPFFIELLFLRAAWHLDIPDVPQLDAALAVRAAETPPDSRAELERQWLANWQLAWQRFDDRPGYADGAPEEEGLERLRSYLAARFWGSSDDWADEIDRDAFNRWQASVRDDFIKHGGLDSPEHRSLPSLVEAWASGVTGIVQLPFAGPYAKRVGRRHLLVSRTTRMDPALYSEALRLRRVQ